MNVKVKKYKDFGRSMKRMLTAMIVSDEAARTLCPIYDFDFMPEMNEISTLIGWCCDYFEDYGKAPGIVIQDIFDTKTKDIDPEEKEEISKFLTVLSSDYEKIKDDDFSFIIHESKRFICTEKRKAIAEELLDPENESQVDDLICELRDLSSDSVDEDNADLYDPLDTNLLFDTIHNQASVEPLFTLPGAVGKILNPHLVRSGFINFQGEEKVGKTWWLIYLYMMALRKRNRCVFFQAGDMTSDDFNRRFISMLTRTATLKANAGEFDDVAVKNGKKIDFITEVIDQTSVADLKKVKRFISRIGKDRARVVTYSNGTLNADIMDRKLQQFYDEGFVADVAVLDYADIMATEPGTGGLDGRGRINKNWMALRSLSQKWKLLLATASQGNKDSRDRIQSKKSVTEDKRKDSHITAGFGLSNHSIYRDQVENNDCFQINQLYARNTAVDGRLVLVQRELRKGQVYVGSTFVKYPGQK
jgi:hypothetical protein